jgi:2-oxoglutarate ferredoxin oxidoreductase subunit gamma
MLSEIIIHGIGGQGALTSGQLLATAALREGLSVSVVPYYAPEVRGGEANAITVVSSEPIGSVLPAQWDVALLLAPRAAAKCAAAMRPGGTVFYNSTLVERMDVPPDVQVIAIPASRIAEDVGNARAANMVLLGALCAHWDVISLESLHEAVRVEFTGRKAKYAASNIAVIDAGADALRMALAKGGTCEGQATHE